MAPGSFQTDIQPERFTPIERVKAERLTPFEWRILELRARGLTRNQIANRLRRSPQTISNALTLAKEKLGAESLMEAAWLLFNRPTD